MREGYVIEEVVFVVFKLGKCIVDIGGIEMIILFIKVVI